MGTCGTDDITSCLAGLPDFKTENPEVREYLLEAHLGLAERVGVDGFRLDTVKHVERDNLLEYVNAWKAHKPGLFVFGENLVKGYGWGDLGGGDAQGLSHA